MRNNSPVYKLYLALVSVVTGSAVILRTIACFQDLNHISGYFENKVFINIANALVLFGIAASLSYIFSSKKDDGLLFKFDTPLNYVFSGALGAALILFAHHSFLVYRDMEASTDTSQKTIMYLALASAIFALAASFHFLLASVFTKRRDTTRADLGLFMVLFLSVYAAYLYFNKAMPLNSPAKVTDQMAYLASAIFFLYETRISIGREKWRAYSAFGLAAFILTAYSAIPSLIIYLFGGATISNSINETILTLTLFLFIAARLILTATLPLDKENETVSLLRKKAAEREAHLNPEPEIAESEAVEILVDPEEYYELNFENQETEMITETQNEENLGN